MHTHDAALVVVVRLSIDVAAKERGCLVATCSELGWGLAGGRSYCVHVPRCAEDAVKPWDGLLAGLGSGGRGFLISYMLNS